MIINPYFISTIPTPIPFGEVFNDSFDRGALGGNYATVGPASWSLPDNLDLQTSGGTTAYTSRLTREYPQAFEEWEQEIDFQMLSAIGAGTFGIGVGHWDLQGNWSFIAHLYLSTSGADDGKIRIVRTNSGNSATVLNQSASTVVLGQNHFYNVIFTKRIVGNNIVYTATGRNVTDGGASVTATWTESLATGQSVYANATGKFCVWSFGGTVKITNWRAEAFDLKNNRSLFVGHSIVHGLCGTNLSTRYAANIDSFYTVSGGSSDNTTSILAKIQNLIDLNAQRYFLQLATNDVSLGTPEATYKANYQSIVSQLEAAGKQCIILYEIPRNGEAIAAFNTWLSTEFVGRTIIDVYTPLNNAGNLAAAYNSGDNVHPNQAGHDLIISTILSAI